MMDLIGRTVRKQFQGFGVFSGTIKSFDPSSQFFEIVYEDGDSEEADLAEITTLLEGAVGEDCLLQLNQRPRVGRKPKKRRKVGAKREICSQSGNFSDDFGMDGINLNRGLDLNHVIDARDAFNLNDGEILKDGLNGSVKFVDNKVRGNGFIDLNLDVKGDFDANAADDSLCCFGFGTVHRNGERNFDLNLGLDDEIKDRGDDDSDKKLKETTSNEGIGVVQDQKNLEGLCPKNVEETSVEGLSCYNRQLSGDSCMDSIGDTQKVESVLGEGLSGNASCSNLDANFATRKEPTEVGISRASESGPGHQDDMEHFHGEGRTGRKRRKISKPTTEVVLRRSARRGSASLRAKNCADSTPTAHQGNDCMLQSSAGAAMPEKHSASLMLEGSVEHNGFPPNFQLPPSSRNLNLEGVPVLDTFSVYACLRSFSTLLFLSPFELEDFAAALKCKYPTSIFDSIHVSLLQILRKHLEFLSGEGSQSATDCLRGLNWSLLDLITWPVFMANYLLFNNNGLKRGLDLNHLKLFAGNYYEQPASVKVEVLRCLCDDVIEAEPIRSELNRRLLAADPDQDFDRSVNSETYKKKRVAMDISGGKCLMEEVVDETDDWNSDECCLCKMDGNLICCDGCPAAYHSKCVGVVCDLLPEGDWYCPECVIDKDKQIKPLKSLRGAELLGVDPHGRLYFSCCGYLLVSDDLCNTEAAIKFYQSCDVNAVFEVLKSSFSHSGGLIDAISKHWNIATDLTGMDTDLDLQIPTFSVSETCGVKDDIVGEITPVRVSAVASGQLGTMTHLMDVRKTNTGSEESAEITDEGREDQSITEHGPCKFNGPCKKSNEPEVAGLNFCVGKDSSTSTTVDIDIKKEKNSNSVVFGYTSSVGNSEGKDALPRVLAATGYTNCYSFASTASTVAEELIDKSSDKISKESTVTVDDIISAQLKIILRKSTKFCWPSLQDINVGAEKEICGWCFSCKAPGDEGECLFKMATTVPVLKYEMAGIHSEREKKGHLIDVIFHILSIEDRLRGLLLGPWLDPYYSKIWREQVLNAPDVKSVKHLLLALESNLHSLAFSGDWLKQVDSPNTIGSASHVVTSSSRLSSKHGFSRKRARNSEFESNSLSGAAAGLGIYWWRGGRFSRQLFCWKVLPRSLACRAARQAGCMKMPGILYFENSEFAKRTKCAAWRAAVEASISVEQLAFQIRDLNMNIRWDDIENTLLLPLLDKESKKSVRSFKKAIIRRKSIEGSAVKYLLDFGKRRSIPNTVSRYGSVVEEKSSEKKKYWLEESHVPLHLLKAFEERRIARKSTKIFSEKLCESDRTIKALKMSGFSYLFLKAQRSENYKCGHCNKDVPVSDAVRCEHCNGFFHKRHVKKSSGAVTAECTYTCQKCRNAKSAMIENARGKVQTKRSKVASTASRPVRLRRSKRSLKNERLKRTESNKKASTCVPLRRSTRKIKYVQLQNKNDGGSKKKRKPVKSNKKMLRKPKKGASWRRKRTQVHHTYWLNGLLLSEKPNDERVLDFKRKHLTFSSKLFLNNVDKTQMQCCLCRGAGDAPSLNVISCDFCGDWFHGDAFGLNVGNFDKLIKFKCHMCRKKDPPVCPYLLGSKGIKPLLGEVKNIGEKEYVEEVQRALSPPSEVFANQKCLSDEKSQGLHPMEQEVCVVSDSNRPEEYTLKTDFECVTVVETEVLACQPHMVQ